MPPAAIIGVGLAAGAAGSIASSNSNKKAAATAAQAQQNVANQSNALQASVRAENVGLLSPTVQRGDVAGNTLNAMLGLGTAEQGAAAQNAFGDYIKNSDYGFQFGTGANGVNSGYAGAGTLQSGAAMKGLEQFRQNLQSGYRGQYTNLLANQQGVGLGAASALAGVGQNYANTVSANNQNAADATSNAALIRGQNNGFANALGLMGGSLFSYGAGKF